MSTPNPSDPIPPPPPTPLQQAFEQVMTKAKWGVSGAVIGVAGLSGLNYFSRDGTDPVYFAILGAAVGAFGGAALAGRGLGPIGYSMIACMLVSGSICCSGSIQQTGLLLLLACCVALGFLIGARSN